MDRLQLGPRHQARGERVANAAAERVDQVFFRVAVGRVVDPLAASALTAVCLEGVLQSRAPRVDQEVAAFQEQIQGLEPVQNQVARPAGDQPRAKHLLVLGIGRGPQRRSSRRRRVEPHQIDLAATGKSIGQLLDGEGILAAHHVQGVVIAKHGHAGRCRAIMVTDLEKHGRRVPRRARVDRAADVVHGIVFGLDGEMPGRVEPREPDSLGRLEELGVDLLPAQPGILI